MRGQRENERSHASAIRAQAHGRRAAQQQPCSKKLFYFSNSTKMEYHASTGPTGQRYRYWTPRQPMCTDSSGRDAGDGLCRQSPVMRNEPPSKRRRTSDRTNANGGAATIVAPSTSTFGIVSPAPSAAQASSIISPERQFNLPGEPNSSRAVHLFVSGGDIAAGASAAPLPPAVATQGGVVTQLSQDTTVSDAECTVRHHQKHLEWWKQRPTPAADASGDSAGIDTGLSSVTCHVCYDNDASVALHGAAESTQLQSAPSAAVSAVGAVVADAAMGTTSTTQQQQPKQKNSLLSYFQVCSNGPSHPSGATSHASAGATATTTPIHNIVSTSPAAGAPVVLTCSYCERPTCASCSRNCESCQKRYCTFCSTVNYDDSRAERIFCLDCDAAAHDERMAMGRDGACADEDGCIDMEE